MPTLSRITIYPLKSFDPAVIPEARVLLNGALEHDRQFALVGSDGKFVNAKRHVMIHPLSVRVDPQARTLAIRPKSEGKLTMFDIDSQRPAIERWFAEYFSVAVNLVENTDGGFPDDDQATGPTIVSTASLQSVADWFPGLTIDEVRLRFRPNLEIDHVEAFWEDRLFYAKGLGDRPVRIGDVVFGGSNPCQRCVVPTRDSTTGTIWPEFAKRFSELRQANLPVWATRDRFDHFYRLTVNTRLVNRGNGIVRVGNQVE